MVTRRFNQSRKELNRFTGVAPRAILRDEHRSRIVRGREEDLIRSSGSYFTWFRRTPEIPCHCHNPANSSGHVNCPACHGTGYLRSYQKHGHETLTFSRTWPGVEMGQTTAFTDGWGWREVAVRDGGPVELFSPVLQVDESWVDLDGFLVDEFEPSEWRLEFTHDGVGWLDIEHDPLDLTHPTVRFRLTVTRGATRFFRVRFRTEMHTRTDLEIPEDVYVLVSTEDRYNSDTVRERERVDVVSETPAWSLVPVQEGDFFVDVSGRLNSLRPDGVYLATGLRATVHETQRSELRREFTLKYIPENTYLHNLYGVWR